jgi:hypothetical protein
MLTLELTSHSIAIAFTDDLLILTRGETVVEAENYMNLEMRKIQEWAQNNKLKFNENKSKVVVCFLLGYSPASEFYMPTFRNTLSVPSS